MEKEKAAGDSYPRRTTVIYKNKCFKRSLPQCIYSRPASVATPLELTLNPNEEGTPGLPKHPLETKVCSWARTVSAEDQPPSRHNEGFVPPPAWAAQHRAHMLKSSCLLTD